MLELAGFGEPRGESARIGNEDIRASGSDDLLRDAAQEELLDHGQVLAHGDNAPSVPDVAFEMPLARHGTAIEQLGQVPGSPLLRRSPVLRESVPGHPMTVEPAAVDVILVGLGNYVTGLMEHLLRRKNAVVGIDFDPGALDTLRMRGMPVLFWNMAQELSRCLAA